MSDRVVIMNAGKVLQIGSPAAIYETPNSRFVAEFLGDTNVLRIARIIERDGDAIRLQIEGGAEVLCRDSTAGPTTEGMLAVFRPEQTVVHSSDPGPGAIKGRVVSTQFRSGLYRWQIALVGANVVLAQSSENRLAQSAADDPVWVTIEPGKVRFVHQ